MRRLLADELFQVGAELLELPGRQYGLGGRNVASLREALHLGLAQRKCCKRRRVWPGREEASVRRAAEVREVARERNATIRTLGLALGRTLRRRLVPIRTWRGSAEHAGCFGHRTAALHGERGEECKGVTTRTTAL